MFIIIFISVYYVVNFSPVVGVVTGPLRYGFKILVKNLRLKGKFKGKMQVNLSFPASARVSRVL
jgi:hypothetical protein